MGSKNLKAITLEGTGPIELADPEGFKQAAIAANKKVTENDFIATRRKYGTPVWIGPMNEYGILPTRNFQTTVFEGAEGITGETMHDTIVKRNKSCFNCTIQCGKQSEISEGEFSGTKLEGPEYELLALLGSNCGMGDLGAVSKASLMCDELGLDGISTGNVVGFAMECYERGLLSHGDFGKLEPRFGKTGPYLELIRRIAYRKGIGNLLAEGVKRASEKIGQDSEDFAIHVKGMEFPGYDPRGAYGMGLAYATSDRGACHQRAWTVRPEVDETVGPRFSIEGRAQLVKGYQDERAAAFSLVTCDFVPLSEDDFAGMVKMATGFEFTGADYLKAGERIWNLIRMYNVREGMTREHDCLPARMEEPVPGGPAKGSCITPEMMNKMLDEYYDLRGWSRSGIPTPEKLKELGLEDYSR
jgi:aldehyde:ferredoxin oxidoreductase